MSRTFASLAYRNYRYWFFSALIANVGTWMQRVAQDWLVLTELTDDSGFAVGMVTGLQFAPTLFITPFGGLLADRVNRRKLLIFTQGAMGVLAGALGWLVISGQAQLWHVYVMAFLLGVVSAIDAPVRQTFVAELVPLGTMPNAVGLNGASFNAARLIGPAAAGLLIAAVGAGWAFVANAVSFVATIVGLLLMRQSDLIVLPHAPSERGQLREGVRYTMHRTDILVIMAVMALVSMFGLNFQLTSAVMAREAFERGAGEYGALSSIMAIGSLAGALIAARRRNPRVSLVIASAFLFGLSMCISAVLPSYWAYAISGIPVGFFASTMMNAANTTIQLSTAPEMRGRVMSFYMMVFLGSTPIGSPIVGWIAEAYGARWSVGVGGIVSILVAAAAGLWTVRHWKVRVRYSLRHRPHLVIDGPRERAAADTAAATVFPPPNQSPA